MSLIKSLPTEIETVRVAVHYHAASAEFTVRTYRDGAYNDSETYFTDDRNDALATQRSIVDRINSDERPVEEITAENLDLSESPLKGDGVAAARWEIIADGEPYGVIRRPAGVTDPLALLEVIARVATDEDAGRKCVINRGHTDGWRVQFTGGSFFDITAI
jgi:hypothetical protein